MGIILVYIYIYVCVCVVKGNAPHCLHLLFFFFFIIKLFLILNISHFLYIHKSYLTFLKGCKLVIIFELHLKNK